MPTSIIIYATNLTYLDKTIDGILDQTPANLVQEIVVYNAGGSNYSRDNVRVIAGTNVGRAQAWNQAIAQTTGDTIVFVKGTTKFGVDWLQPILEILKEEPSALVTPIVHVLDTTLWLSEPNRWKRFGWRWDLELYDRPCVGSPDSPAISSNCIAANRAWLTEIGQFDDGMVVGAGEDLELSIRNWLLGGHIFVADESTVACVHEVDAGSGTINNHARIAEAWLQKYAHLFYNLKGIKPSEVNTGRLNNFLRFREKQKHSFEWYLSTQLPELYGIYSLKGTAAQKRIAVVGPGSSLDYVDNGYINSFDMIIGVDYVGKIFDCDYIVSDSATVVTELRATYSPTKFVLPMAIKNTVIGEYTATSELVEGSHQFEYGVKGALPKDLNPPFCNFGSSLLAAIHFALFLQPSQITLFGCDNKLIGGRSHTTKIEYYEDGKIWPNSDSTRRNLAYYEFGLDHLGKLGNSHGIPILRITHA